ncbi:hypothetical protein SLE2022_098180 [Rubroshorea leprosula]
MSLLTEEKAREFCCTIISKAICKLLYAVAIFVCLVAGATFGFILGALVGIRKKTGCLRGALIGGIKCSLFFPKLLKLSLSLWRTSDDIATPQLLQRMVALHTRNKKGSRKGKGLSTTSVQNIKITEENILDTSRNRISCSICLQDFLLGETTNCLPKCQHMFHQLCIDRWLTEKRSCPLCRKNL